MISLDRFVAKQVKKIVVCFFVCTVTFVALQTLFSVRKATLDLQQLMKLTIIEKADSSLLKNDFFDLQQEIDLMARALSITHHIDSDIDIYVNNVSVASTHHENERNKIFNVNVNVSHRSRSGDFILVIMYINTFVFYKQFATRVFLYVLLSALLFLLLQKVVTKSFQILITLECDRLTGECIA